MCSKDEAFRHFTDSLLEATKALPAAERFSLTEVKRLTEYASSTYIASLKLQQLVYTESQALRESHTEVFLQTPAVPPPTSSAVEPTADADGEEEYAPEDQSVVGEGEAPPASAGGEAEADAPPAEGEAAPPPPALGDEQLTEAISATIAEQAAAVQQQMAAEYAAQEQALLERIAALEARAK